MNLPNAKHREEYIELVKELEDELKAATGEGHVSDLALHTLQQKLDVIAGKYQDDEKIGSARYKLYELQAFVHYFDHRDEQALEFINLAIELRGNSYQKAENLKNILLDKNDDKTASSADESKLTKAEKRKRLIGLEGWLALFIVGQFLALIITLYRFFSDGFLSSSDIESINQYQSGLGDTLQTLTAFENVMIVIYVALVITTLVLLFRRRKLAKPFAIATLVFVTLYGIIDYSIASSIFNSSGLSENAEIQSLLNKSAGDVGKNVIAALIWIPYFFVSKRVKATLNKE